MAFLEVSGLSKSYGRDGPGLQVLRDLELSVEAGEMVAVMGASGVGKSTLMQVLGGLDRSDAGQVRVGEIEVSALRGSALDLFRNQQIGFVFQFHHLLPEFDALENVAMPLRVARVGAARARDRAAELLEQVGLRDRQSHRPGMLSGGEQQRVAVARALVMRPALLLADEPTGDLDEQTGSDLHGLIRKMHTRHGLTSLIATHNPTLADGCDRIFRLEDGRLRPGAAHLDR